MAEPVCPYCRMLFDEASPPKIFCTACGMPHHEDCYLENGGCTVFGCKRAPADEPKVQVALSDLSAVAVPAQQYAPVAQQYVPVVQQPAPVQGYQPSRYSGPLGLSQAAATAPAQVPAGAPNPQQPASPAAYAYAAPVYGSTHKSRTSYIVLGIFLGALGIHNFYAGYTGRAVGQLCLTVLTVGYLGIVSWIWAIIEICTVEKDSTGLRFS
ncbi:MAG TPA: NINE protein [Candidatus Angelobacter sp.]|jgi:TM2 domain-containing membrane protein YozV|nr:NINE protein [Candidatus Angelobacter sp.]